MSDEIDAPAARCANCAAVLHGRFCAACGQPVKPLDPPVRYFWREFAQELFDVDSRVLRSLRRLVFSPGFLTREHADGRRVAWVSPLKLYLLTSVAVFAVLAIAGDDGGLRIQVTGVPSGPRSMMRAPSGSRASCSCWCRSSRGWSRSSGGRPADTIRRTSCSRSTSMPPRSPCER